MVTRIVLILWPATVLALAGAGCSGGPAAEGEAGRLGVVVGFYPLAFAAERVGGGTVDVHDLTPPGAEPHDVELTARDVERIRSADLVLYLGGGFQPALERALESSDVRAVDVLEEVEVREREHGDGHGHEDDEDEYADGERPVDPHVWLDPLRYAAVVERIGRELGRERQAAELAAELEALDAEYVRGLADCARREIVVPHDAFGYLATRYGLEQTPIRGGLLPEAEATSRQLERAVEHVREQEVTTVFVEPLRASDVGEAVAREAGVRTAVLDPVEGLSRTGRERGDDYFSVMRANLAALRGALGCR